MNNNRDCFTLSSLTFSDGGFQSYFPSFIITNRLWIQFSDGAARYLRSGCDWPSPAPSWGGGSDTVSLHNQNPRDLGVRSGALGERGGNNMFHGGSGEYKQTITIHNVGSLCWNHTAGPSSFIFRGGGLSLSLIISFSLLVQSGEEEPPRCMNKRGWFAPGWAEIGLLLRLCLGSLWGGGGGGGEWQGGSCFYFSSLLLVGVTSADHTLSFSPTCSSFLQLMFIKNQSTFIDQLQTNSTK